MRKCTVNLLSCICIAIVVGGLGYGLLWATSQNSPVSIFPFFPTLLGEDAGAPGASSHSGAAGSIGSEPAIGGRRGGGDGASPKPPARGKKKPVSQGGGAGGAPPSCWPCISAEEKDTRKIMVLLGCFLAILTLINPLIIFWSLGSSWPNTANFHSFWDLVATAASSFAWLLFAATQLHTEDNNVASIAAVLVNGVTAAIYTFCCISKVATNTNVSKKGLVGAAVALCVPIFVATYFVVFGPIKTENKAAICISYGAALVQMISQLLPFRSFCLVCCPPPGEPAQHVNAKRLIIYSRGWNLTVCFYWAIYCVYTYNHDFFEIANISSAVFAVVTFALHAVYALEPPPPDQAVV